MCGISGLLNFDRNQAVDQNALFRMTDILGHRGPDDEGYVIDGNLGLGHKRLGIMDPTPAGHQPMSSPDGRYWIVFNGEIYNFIEIRDLLSLEKEDYKSKSDTEVLLHMFIRYGAECLGRLRGMFAFAVWDSKERSLFLARDPFGIKPLYFRKNRERFLFASEIKSILACEGDGGRIDHRALADYLTFQYTLDERTLFRDIHKLQPGCWMEVRQDGSCLEEKYWAPTFSKRGGDYTQTATDLRELLEKSVSIQLRSDVPLGGHLSGGLDTAIIASLASSNLGAPFKTFTAGFGNEGGIYDDTRAAGNNAAYLGTEHFEINLDHNDFTSSFMDLIWALDEPVAAPGTLPQFFVSKLASQKVKVVLGGQGADEMFGGYARYYLLYLEKALQKALTGEPAHLGLGLPNLLPGLGQMRNYGPMIKAFLGSGLFGPADERYFSLIRRQNDPVSMLEDDVRESLGGYDTFSHFMECFNAPGEVELLDKILNFETCVWLPALLQVEDRTSMFWSVESRVPFLDTAIADFAFSLPAAVKFRGGKLKGVLRQAVTGLLPEAVVNRRDKIGFPVPLHEWFKGPLRDWLYSFLLDRRTLERGIFRKESVLSGMNTDGAYSRALWGLISLEACFRLLLDGDGLPKSTMAEERTRPIVHL